MKALIILCHPNEASFNHAVARRIIDLLLSRGDQPVLHDLYREHFDPVLSLAEYRRRFSFEEQVQAYAGELADCGVLVIVHPDWWGQAPAVLKGWLDRVLVPGVAYEHEGAEFMPRSERPLLVGKKALVVITTDEPEGSETHPLVTIWKEKVFGFVGIDDASCLVFHRARTSTTAERAAWLDEVEKAVEKLVAEKAG